MTSSSPDFGKADLTNCERELIHLAGSIQPHGVLLVLDPDSLRVVQASANAEEHLGFHPQLMLDRPIATVGADLERVLVDLLPTLAPEQLRLLRCNISVRDLQTAFDGSIHQLESGPLIVELERSASDSLHHTTPPLSAEIRSTITNATRRFSEAITIGSLANDAVSLYRDLTGFDRVMVYKFDLDGHGEIIAEARTDSLDSLLGHHYPASDIPQRARELYLRNRVRILVDVNYEPVPLLPRYYPPTGQDLDMSLCGLRSMSPLHIQYLKNMGVTATMVVSLVREGQLWGLIACHHYSSRYVPLAVRLACDLLAEVLSTRIAAIENYAQTQVAFLVRRLEQRLIEATAAEGDWRYALLRNPSQNLLQPLASTGAALFFEDEILTAGDVPSTPELRQLGNWIAGRITDSIFTCTSIVRENPQFAALTPTASGILAVELSATQPDFLIWFRKEQLSMVTWAGDPNKPVSMDNPLELSPRRSFAAWSEIVRGSAKPWSNGEIVLARAIGEALVDIILQVQAVRLLIAQHQMSEEQKRVENSKEPVLLLGTTGSVIFYNKAFSELFGRPPDTVHSMDDVSALFSDPTQAKTILMTLVQHQRPWRGELLAMTPQGQQPLAVRGDIVPGIYGASLGLILLFTDLANTKKAEEARRHLELSLRIANTCSRSNLKQPTPMPDAAVHAIIANASMAAMDIADSEVSANTAALFAEVEASAQRATDLYQRLQSFLDH